MINSGYLIGKFEDFAKEYCQRAGQAYDIIYTQDKKTVGKDKIVIATRSTDNKITLVVGSFKIEV